MTKYVLYGDKLADQIIFKIPEVALLSVFVTDRFKNRVEEAGLTGFCFTEIQT
ncbi:MAG: imm11 family protein [Blastocatellia bacterium]